jgi:precorrin-4/cobalt-precorrin-4 C11-methyltransferase
MTISFVGAGPGAVDLITVRGAQRLATADIVIWAASLVPETLLQHCREDVVLHDSKSMTFEQVCAVYEANPGAAIVRLHSGDTSVYSAIGEQIDWCRQHGREFDVVPGVTSMSAAAAAVGCELTVPGVAQTVVMTRMAKRTSASMPPTESLAGAVGAGGTLALFLSIGHVGDLVAELVDGPVKLPPDTPVVAAHRVSWPDETIVRTTLARLPAEVDAAGLKAATMLLIGPALAEAAPPLRSHVYAASYTTRFRRGTAAPGSND